MLAVGATMLAASTEGCLDVRMGHGVCVDSVGNKNEKAPLLQCQTDNTPCTAFERQAASKELYAGRRGDECCSDRLTGTTAWNRLVVVEMRGRHREW